MKRENLIGYMRDPSMLNEYSLTEVEELAREYPYFQTAHMLLARNHHNMDSLKFHDMLRSAAAFAGDRTVLYHLIHTETAKPGSEYGESAEADAVQVETGITETGITEAGQAETGKTEGETEPEDGLAGRLTEILSRETAEADLEYAAAYSLDDETGKAPSQTLEGYTFTGWFDHIGDQTEETGTFSEQNDMIDKFLKERPGMNADPESEYDRTDRSETFTRAGDSLMTETLAKIYLKQGLLKKAIYAYEKLSLKYPEKSTYFATQINRIKSKLAEN